MDVDGHNDDYNPILILLGLVDSKTSRIIMSTMNFAKTVSEICQENGLSRSSTYRIIGKLYKSGLLSVAKNNIGSKGRKVSLYRSRIKSLKISLRQGEISVESHKNDLD